MYVHSCLSCIQPLINVIIHNHFFFFWAASLILAQDTHALIAYDTLNITLCWYKYLDCSIPRHYVSYSSPTEAARNPPYRHSTEDCRFHALPSPQSFFGILRRPSSVTGPVLSDCFRVCAGAPSTFNCDFGFWSWSNCFFWQRLNIENKMLS